MILLALLAILTDGVVSVPPSHWTVVEVPVSQAGTIVDVSFSVPSGATSVETMLMTRRDAERFNAGRSNRAVCRSGYQTEGRIRCEVEQKGDYVLVIDNRIEARNAAQVSVKITMRPPSSIIATTVPPAKQAVIITLGLLFFVAVVMYSARQFMR